MLTSRRMVIALASLGLLLASCSDGDDELDTGASDGADSSPAPGDVAVEVPDRPADMVGEITAVSPFEPVTEDCVPAEDLDPDGAVSSDDPPVCTPEDNEVLGTVLVEEQPGVQEGRKISFTVTTGTAITGSGAGGGGVAGYGDLAEGQEVDAWVEGDVCAESYPEQCGAEALRVKG